MMWDERWFICPQHRVVVPKAGKVSDLCSALSEMTDVPPTQVGVFVSDLKMDKVENMSLFLHFALQQTFEAKIVDASSHKHFISKLTSIYVFGVGNTPQKGWDSNSLLSVMWEKMNRFGPEAASITG